MDSLQLPNTWRVEDALEQIEDDRGIRRFTNPYLQDAMNRAVVAAGDKPVVVVAHHVFDRHGNEVENVTKISLLVKKGDEFSLAVAGYKDWTSRDLGLGAEVIWTP